MYYDSLPDWSELNRRIDANEELDPVEQFIYDNEPSGHSEAEEFRKQFQLALSFYGGAPLNNSEEKQNDQPTQVKSSADATSTKIAEVVDYIDNMLKVETSARHILSHVLGTLRQLLLT